MTPGLLLPAGLLALAGILVPLLIHLTRRSELQVHEFAALRWLSAKARPQRQLRFDERLLLAVRLALITVLALLLAQPILSGWPAASDWLVVVPGADLTDMPGPAAENPSEQRWLAPGFPALDSPVPAASADSNFNASLLRELDTQLAPGSALSVVVPTELGGLDGERPRLSRPVAWHVTAGAAVAIEPTTPSPAKPQGLWLAYAPERAAELGFVRAAATAHAALEIRGEIPLDAAMDQIDWPALDSDRLIWLSGQALPPTVLDWLAEGGQILRIGAADPAADGDPVTVWRGAEPGSEVRASTFGHGRLMVLATVLVPEQLPELLEPDFPDLLNRWLKSSGPAPARATAESHAPLSDRVAWPPPSRELGDALALLIALLFLVERWLASSSARLANAPGRLT